MGTRNKLKRFAENDESKFVLQQGKELFETIKGNWNQTYFKNDNPITLELGCGRGEYTIGLAKLFPEKNIIGVDIKGARIWFGSSTAEEEELYNTAFLRTQILMIERFFEPGEVDEIWVTFPDPRMRDRDERRRLISPRFLDLYRKILKPNGIVHLKTDDFPLYDYSVETVKEQGLTILSNTDDLYNSGLLDDHHGLQTAYEKRYLTEGKKINYLKFELK